MLCYKIGKWLKMNDATTKKEVEADRALTNFFFSMELSAFKLAMWLCSLLFSLDCSSNLYSKRTGVRFPCIDQFMMIVRLTCDRIPSSLRLSFLQFQFVFASQNHASFPPTCGRRLTSFGRFSQ